MIRPVVQKAFEAAWENEREVWRVLEAIVSTETNIPSHLLAKARQCLERKAAWDRRPWSR